MVYANCVTLMHLPLLDLTQGQFSILYMVYANCITLVHLPLLDLTQG